MLPTSRAALYREIIAIMLGMRNHDQDEELRDLLATVALQLYQTKGRNFTLQELVEILSTDNQERSLQILRTQVALILDSGLLDVVAFETYGFKHQMFQEYLAAIALARQLCSPDESTRHTAWEFAWRKHAYSRWTEVLRLLVGVLVQEHGEEGSQIAATWLRRLADERQTPDGDVGNLCLELAIRSLREFSQALSPTNLADVARTLVSIWAKELQANPQEISPPFRHLQGLIEDIRLLDVHLVIPALTLFEEIRDHGNVGLYTTDKISRLLKDLHVPVPARVLQTAFHDVPHISVSASTLSATLQQHAAIEPVMKLLQEKQEHWRVREGAARLLGRWGDQTPVALLSEVLQDSTSYYQIRVAATEALGNQGERIPIEPLLVALRDPHERVRVAAVRALGNLENGSLLSNFLLLSMIPMLPLMQL